MCNVEKRGLIFLACDFEAHFSATLILHLTTHEGLSVGKKGFKVTGKDRRLGLKTVLIVRIFGDRFGVG